MAYQENIIFENAGNEGMAIAWRRKFIATNVEANLLNQGIELIKFNCHPSDGEEGIHVTVRENGVRYNINLDANVTRFLPNQSPDVATAIQAGVFGGLLQELQNAGMDRTFMMNLCGS